MKQCMGCGANGELLCNSCRAEVNNLWQPKFIQLSSKIGVTSYFCYEGVIRRLVLKAKVDTDWAAAGLCRALMIQACLFDSSFKTPDTIITAPANMRSRFMLRLNLAEYLGAGLAGFFRCSWRRAPWYLHFKTKKRAEDHRITSESCLVTKLRQIDNKMKLLRKVAGPSLDQILVIDDVVTTGFTMASICTEHQHTSRGLAFCYAPSIKALSNGLCVTD